MEKIASKVRQRVACLDRDDSPHPMAQRAAATNCALLLTGETGTGKGYLARWIHERSSRASKPFVPVNCGAIPENLIDSHLFGHVKGSFSGATNDHPGLIRAASGGTILFDEVSELPLQAQTRLLRLLEEREVQPVGLARPIVVDVRVMAATNSDLEAAVRQGRFRQDLYFRLDIVRVPMKPLRERVSEIPSLARLFNDEFASLYRQPTLSFSDEALQMLQQYRWPGNVRELRSVIERLHVLRGPVEADVSVDDLRRFGQLQMNKTRSSDVGANRFHEIKVEAVNDMISACRGNVSRAASRLGVHRSTVYRWLAGQTVSA